MSAIPSHLPAAHTDLATQRLAGSDISSIPALLDPFASLLATHNTLYAWASTQPQARALRGRAPVFVANVPGTDETVVVRHAWHGGLFAPLTGDRFRRPTRAPLEYANSYALRAAGIPTTVVLGFARYDAGFGTCRVDVASRFVPEAFDLGMIAAGLVPQLSCEEAFDATLSLLRSLALAGVVHPDLNVKNVLVTRSDETRTSDQLTAMIIDVDVVQWVVNDTARSIMQRNVARLTRSVRKWRTHFGCAVTDQALDRFTRDALRTIPDTGGS